MKDNLILGKFTPAPSVPNEELKAAYERIADLEDLARNVAGLDMRLINDWHVIRQAVIEWRDQAGELLS